MGGGTVEILASKGRVLVPRQGVFQGGGGAQCSGGNRGRIEAKRIKGGTIQQKDGKEENWGTITKIIVKVIVVIPLILLLLPLLII